MSTPQIFLSILHVLPTLTQVHFFLELHKMLWNIVLVLKAVDNPGILKTMDTVVVLKAVDTPGILKTMDAVVILKAVDAVVVLKAVDAVVILKAVEIPAGVLLLDAMDTPAVVLLLKIITVLTPQAKMPTPDAGMEAHHPALAQTRVS